MWVSAERAWEFWAIKSPLRKEDVVPLLGNFWHPGSQLHLSETCFLSLHYCLPEFLHEESHFFTGASVEGAGEGSLQQWWKTSLS